MRFISSLLLLSSTLIACSSVSQASTYNGAECYQCTSLERQSKANSWAMNNISKSSLGSSNSKTVNVVDLYNKEISTYKVWLESTPLPPPRPPEVAPRSSLTATSSTVQKYMNNVKTSIKGLHSSAQNIEIQTGGNTGIENAWSFVNCAFCKAEINSQLNDSMYSSMRTAEASLITIGKAFGLLKTDIPDQFLIPLSSGGHIKVTLKLLSQPIKIEATINEVVDEQGNTIPKNAKELADLRIRVGSSSQAHDINITINNFNYFIPIRTGTVTIKDCSGIDAPACGG
ncbi:hypothetical protein [Pseudoalteromonas sp. SR41-4]|uniref:hypothetical protein n=1 Tax=Pseudoalteromonas sp. SR41-4 TaxID=2760950 RepID=UPI001603E61E|nr:hypothetical protein [Pseudoalteromonas sp. SR41-4]MBB1292971.1 hypothetical protein [Pseudoalteromonas sp. SR41-4]